MMIVRPATPADLGGLKALAESADTGMTTVPTAEKTIMTRIERSVAAVAGTGRARAEDTFFFVTEKDGAIIGMSTIFPSLGEDRPFYSYRIGHIAKSAPELDIEAQSDILILCNDFHGYDEIATLLVSEKARGSGAGRLTSLSRFLFMKSIEERLSGKVMAEIRGRFLEDGSCPFWDAIASKFFKMSFDEADRRSAHDFRFIADLMPKYPIYTEFLPTDVRENLGTPHHLSGTAMKMLESEGFEFTRCIDIFDGGPSIEAPLSRIRTVASSETAETTIDDNAQADHGERWLAANPAVGRFCATVLHRGPHEGQLKLTSEEAKGLGLEPGETVVASPMRTQRDEK
ncbi:MAG: arginine N-succinyltransferase [Pseudomonadota bacterium]